MARQLVAIDISHYQSTPDFAAAKAAGLVAVIFKATQGTSYVDNTYAARRSAAESAGLQVSTYHFLEHGNVAAQMKHYLDTVDPENGERVIVDYEDTACRIDDLHQAVQALMDDKRNLQITVYGGSLLEQHLGTTRDALLADNTSLWTAQYNDSAPQWPTATWSSWALWQYSDGSVGGQPRSMAGFKPPFDCNAFNGSAANCEKWFTPVGLEPQPQPGPEPEPAADEEVSLSMTVTSGVKVSIVVNEELVYESEAV